MTRAEIGRKFDEIVAFAETAMTALNTDGGFTFRRGSNGLWG